MQMMSAEEPACPNVRSLKRTSMSNKCHPKMCCACDRRPLVFTHVLYNPGGNYHICIFDLHAISLLQEYRSSACGFHPTCRRMLRCHRNSGTQCLQVFRQWELYYAARILSRRRRARWALLVTLMRNPRLRLLRKFSGTKVGRNSVCTIRPAEVFIVFVGLIAIVVPSDRAKYARGVAKYVDACTCSLVTLGRFRGLLGCSSSQRLGGQCARP